MSRIWAGMESGKGHHHGLALDADGKTLLSRGVTNDEPELLKLVGAVLDLAGDREVTWAIDMTGREPALLLALLINHSQEVLHLPGRLVNRASDGYRGEGKTDARDARALAEAAVEAAERRHTAVPGEKTIAKLVHTLAEEVMTLNEQIREMDKLIEGRFREHELADIVLSVPGIGAILGADSSPPSEAAWTSSSPGTPWRRAPASPRRPRDSGRVSGNLHRGDRCAPPSGLGSRRPGGGPAGRSTAQCDQSDDAAAATDGAS